MRRRTNKDALLGFWMGLELPSGYLHVSEPHAKASCLNMHAVYMECGPPTLPQNGVDAYTFHKPHAKFHRGVADIGSGLPISMTIPRPKHKNRTK